jgi:peptidoglycan/LPS O-acetylase OafA/YrhL
VDLEQLILLIVALVLVSIIFYVSAAIVGSDWSLDSSYILRILVVSLVAVVVIPVFRSAADSIDLGDLGLLLAFVILVIVVRFVLIEELPVSDEWLAALVVSLIAVALIYAVDAISRALVDVQLLSLF